MDTVESLRLQLAEYEMLKSMYPDDREFCVDDPMVIPHISEFVEERTNDPPPRLSFAVYLTLDKERSENDCHRKSWNQLELSCSLPTEYPVVHPEVYVRCSSLNREQQHLLNDELAKYQDSILPGEISIVALTQWLREQAPAYIEASQRTPDPKPQIKNAITTNSGGLEKFSRLWIYSHHIYNKGKRRAILELAHDFTLSGFCLPGKPGIICAEGYSTDCEAFWQRVRHMNWKKIMLKKEETETGTNDKVFRKFKQPLEELSFAVKTGPGRDYRQDMGAFFHFLEEHHCGHVFKDYFGVDGDLHHHNGH